MFKPGGLFGPKPGQAALDQAVGGSSSASKSRSSTDVDGSSRGGGGDGGGGGDKGYSGSGFDPRGLERAAKAAKVCVIQGYDRVCSRLLCDVRS